MANGVVDLVRTRVREIFALEPDLRAAHLEECAECIRERGGGREEESEGEREDKEQESSRPHERESTR